MIERTAPRSRFVVAVMGVALIGVALGIAPPLARAQTNQTAPALMTLVSQDPWTTSGGQLKVQLRIPATAEAAAVIVTAHAALGSRAAFDRVAEGGDPARIVNQITLPLTNYPDQGGGVRNIEIGVGGEENLAGVALTGLRAPGVYPLTFALAGSDERNQFTTFAVVVAGNLFGQAQALTPRHAVALVWPLTTGPAKLPNGTADPGVTADLAPRGRIGRQLTALTRQPGLPITVAPGPNTMAARANDRNAVLAALATAQILSSPYVPIDLPALIEAGSASLGDRELAVGNTELSQYLGRVPDIFTGLVNPVNTAGLALLRGRGTNRVVVSNLALINGTRTIPRTPFSLPVPPTESRPETSISAVASDDGITNWLRDPNPALAAQKVLAALALTAYANANSAKGTVLVNPADLDAPEATFDALLAGLRDHPWLNPVTLDDFYNQIPATSNSGVIELRELSPYRPPALLVKPVALNAAEQQVAALQTFIGADDPGVIATERWLLSIPSITFTGPTGVARARATLAQTRISAAQTLNNIQVPNPGTITLTSATGSIPLTFRNNLDRAVRLRITLTSEKLTFPDGNSQEIELPPANTTVRVAVETRTSGTFPLRLLVTSGDGTLTIANQQFKVRATAVSTIGIMLMVGAVIVLALWWILDARRRRRRRRENKQSE